MGAAFKCDISGKLYEGIGKPCEVVVGGFRFTITALKQTKPGVFEPAHIGPEAAADIAKLLAPLAKPKAS